MGTDLISKKTRNEFREFLVRWPLRKIEMGFDAAGIIPDRLYEPNLGGERREFVEQHYHVLDFTNPVDVRRLLTAYENILNESISESHDQADKDAIERLFACLMKDGFEYQNGKIRPLTQEARIIFDDMSKGNSISEVTRRNIADAITVGNIAWWGRLADAEFLSRLYNLKSLPSHDPRYKSAEEDIQRHRDSDCDWPHDWIFTDSRFNLLQSPDETFLKFLCAMVHPYVRDDGQEVASLVSLFNQHLAPDGWKIVETTKISDRPVFEASHLILGVAPALCAAKPIFNGLNEDYLNQQIRRMEDAIKTDPELAIGTAKEFLETICKTILQECGEKVADGHDLQKLVKQVREKLNLLPENISEKAKGAETIKRMLSNLGTVVQSLAEIRNLYGSGHGKHAKVKGLQPRHAKLAVGAASTLAIFLFETYKERPPAS